MLMELIVMERRYQAVLLVIRDGESVVDVSSLPVNEGERYT